MTPLSHRCLAFECCSSCSKIKAWIHHWKLGNAVKNPHKSRWEEDYELIENEGLFQEYLEMGEGWTHLLGYSERSILSQSLQAEVIASTIELVAQMVSISKHRTKSMFAGCNIAYYTSHSFLIINPPSDIFLNAASTHTSVCQYRCHANENTWYIIMTM